MQGRSACEGLPPAEWVSQLRNAVGQSNVGYSEQADLFGALADPTRIQILDLLARKGELCVCEIQAATAQTQSLTSHHANVLKRAHLIRARKEGRWMYYSLEEGVSGLLSASKQVLEAR
ncbi:MAG: helix-turn-helix transcriptional regulator [Nitrososphaerota archaeon]|nr:helix-turn-helix transcriptional regulator [Nitrososphaerota archaeon]